MSFGDYAGLPDDAIQEFIQYLTDAIELFDEIKDNTTVSEYKNALNIWRNTLESYRDDLIGLLNSQRGITIQLESDGEDDSTITEIMLNLRNAIEFVSNNLKDLINKIEQLGNKVNLTDDVSDVFRKITYEDFLVFKDKYYAWLSRIKDAIGEFITATENDWKNPSLVSKFKMFMHDIDEHLSTIDKYAKHLNLYDLYPNISRIFYQRDALSRLPSYPKTSNIITDVVNNLTELVNKMDEQLGGK
jgi:tetratricopeptide (TPR) repeat protein